ncbi:MAG: sigma-70 family RNA polymerase sigma factor [Saprospiraceae bacterium]|nr:sigma-70 family RNA polymerase sigma factor [Saprospiraceae bacterium]MBK7738176.1 sigma-70 family RNA polymerase sigma factor [Saprospiraceae bacterium]
MIKNDFFEDSDLLVRLSNEDEHAIRLLYERVFPKASAMVMANRGNLDQAKDIFQEAIIVLITKLREGGSSIQNPANYLYGICRILWINELKRVIKFRTSEMNELPSELMKVEENDDMDEIDLLSKVLIGLSELKEDCRNILELFFFKKLKSTEVAKILSLDDNYIRIKKMRCLQYLRNSIK